MNIGDLLRLDDNSELLETARQRWATWADEHPPLRVVDEFCDLRAWLRSVDRNSADAVLLSLAMLAAPDGGDDVAAAAALAKCLLPGACVEAGRLTEMFARGQITGTRTGRSEGHINELVASQLWIECRTFPWRRLRKVTANILVNTRVAVLRELGDNAQMWRTDRAWANTLLVDDLSAADTGLRASVPPADVAGLGPGTRVTSGMFADPATLIDCQTPAEELSELLAWACDERVITPEDRALLVCLVEEAAGVETSRIRRGCGGLTGNELSARVAPKLGVSEATVRRRASKSIRALATAAPARFADDG